MAKKMNGVSSQRKISTISFENKVIEDNEEMAVS